MKKTLALVLVLVMALTLFAGCNKEQTTTKDTLTFVTYQAPDNLDPMYSVWGEKNTLHNIYDCLLKFDAEGKMAPALAESWELSEDGLTYTFKLRQGVTFHDGSPFSADDVIFSMDTMMASAMNGSMISYFASWAKVDDFTVTISRNAPYVQLLEALALVGFIVPSETYNAETFPTNPIGTGAYKFVSQAEDDSVTLVANENYFLGAPAIKNIIVKAPLDASAAVIALETGEADVLSYVTVDQLALIKANDDLDFITGESYYNLMLLMLSDTLKNDLNLRKAIYHGINPQNAIDVSQDGVGTPCTDMFAKKLLGDLVGKVNIKGYDEALAKDYLAKSNYDGRKLKLTITPDVAADAQSIQADLHKIGIEIEIEQLDANDWTTKLVNGEIEMTLGGFGSEMQSATNLLKSFSSSSKYYGGRMGRTEKYDEYYDLLTQATDDATRTDLVIKCMQEIYEAAGFVPLYDCTVSAAFNKNVKGVNGTNAATYIFYFGELSFAN